MLKLELEFSLQIPHVLEEFCSYLIVNLHMDNRDSFEGEGGSFMIGPNSFGHVGLGGSSATFADPDCKMSFGYLVNRLGGEYLISNRRQSLIDSAYSCLSSS